MKRKLLGSLLGLAATIATVASSYGQGSVWFSNYRPNDNLTVPVTFNTVNVPAGKAGLNVGSTFSADLLYSLNGGTTFTLLAGSTRSFLGATDGDAGSGAGFFTGGIVTIPDYPAAGGAPISFIVRAFNGAAFGTSTINGQSAAFTVPSIATGLNPAGSLTGLTSFKVQNVVLIPEPTSLTLAGFGAAAMLLLRRKK